jgi:hypothetical protein
VSAINQAEHDEGYYQDGNDRQTPDQVEALPVELKDCDQATH